MSHSAALSRIAFVSLLGATLAAGASAQAPPIKPGLWEVRSEREVDGKAVASPAANLQNLPPEVRAKVEAMMKAKGIAPGAAGSANRICMSKETLDPARWQGQSASCKTQIVSRTATIWKWHTSCTQPPAESDGETVFASAESYTVRNATTMTVSGETRTTRSTVQGKWLGADCGDLKPLKLETK